ncbi:hypothetical protein HDU92_005578 [Lobulomyces angularis]|nr:hypothetical protein HDU92_005578 [Lobulomyces angularis]
MSHYLAFTMAGALTAGGVMGYQKKKSTSSLISGLFFGGLYAYSGFYILRNRPYGLDLALTTSLFLVMIFVPKARKTRQLQHAVIGALGLFSVYHFGSAFHLGSRDLLTIIKNKAT